MGMNRGKIIIILMLMTISISLLVYSFAYTTTTHTGEDSNYLMVSEISFGLTDAVESINLSNQVPTIDKFGINNQAFSFSINNNSNNEQQYTLRLVDGQTISTISNDEIRYQLTKNGVTEDIKYLSNNGVIDSGIINKGDSFEYSIIVWLSFDAVTTDGMWDKIIKIEAGSTNIDNSGANTPILLDNMIPVYYDNDDFVWKKADRTNSNINYQWYNYDDRMWANAVTIYSNSEIDYNNITEGTEIPLEDISMFYVWIPRFKYEFFESDSPKLINVSFEKGIDNTGTLKCTIDNGNEICNDDDDSYTHPAFSFDGNELTGYWINKFELGSHPSTDCYKENSNHATSCDVDNLLLISKPNAKQVQYISPLNLFSSIRKMELNNNIYGFSNVGTSLNFDGSINGDNNNYDIHLSRNLEIGALTYLIYSKYGIYSDLRYTDNLNIPFGNQNHSQTGSSYVNDVSYNYDVDYYGTGASSTGNIYGVYDLNGKVKEYVMIMLDTDYTKLDSTNVIEKKYLDLYTDGRFRYGDGLREFEAFDGNELHTVSSLNNMMIRTGIMSNEVFNGNILTTTAYPYIGGRSVITIEQDIYITKW